MTFPSKLSPNITKRIDDNIALGLTDRLAAESAGVTYKTFNEWNQKGQTDKSGKYSQFAQHINKCNAEGAKKLLENLNAPETLETRGCACGFSNVVSVTILAGVCTQKQMLFQKT
jgi:hypothetical protein